MDGGVFRPGNDRRERPVDVEHERRQPRLRRQGGDLGRQLHEAEHTRPYPPRVADRGTTLRLVLIGLVSGVFSALFGVGGGIVIVPLLVLWLRLDQRQASATSLAAIGLIALVGVTLYAVRGHVEVGPGLLVGIPAAAGAVAGAVLQQRLPVRVLSFAFSALLAAIGAYLVFS